MIVGENNLNKIYKLTKFMDKFGSYVYKSYRKEKLLSAAKSHGNT